MLFRVGILGMGRIAAGFDKPDDAAIRTHLKAILAEPRLEIGCVADTEISRATAELARFGVNADVVSVDTILNGDLDVLCIASPDGTHLSYLERAVAGTASVIVSEKPIDGKGPHRRSVLSALEARNSVLVVNHFRRWIPSLASWIAEARAGGYGKPISSVVHYSRGFRHNGVHALDLIGAFIGTKVADVRVVGEEISDYGSEDPTRSLHVSLDVNGKSVPLFFIGVDGRKQTAFEVDIRFEGARVRIFDQDGVRAELYRPAAVDVAGFAPELVLASSFCDKPPRLIAGVWQNVAAFLETKEILMCAGLDALRAYDLADEILDHLPQ